VSPRPALRRARPITRGLLHTELQELWLKTGKTIVFVTHNVREAVVLGDRVVVMSPRPATLVAEHRIGLPRPRQMQSEHVIELAGKIASDLRLGEEPGPIHRKGRKHPQ
jgi:NitT/TauT family transport system ATP-binding protein